MLNSISLSEQVTRSASITSTEINGKVKGLANSEEIDFFQFLAKFKSAGFRIPETLIELGKNEVIFLDYEDGKVRRKIYSSGKKFFEKMGNTEKYLKFIHFSEKGVEVFYSEKDAVKCWNAHQGTFHKLQRFLKSYNDKPSKFRVHWKANKQIKCFSCQSVKPYPVTEPKKIVKNKNSFPAHMHKLAKFPYAGQVFASSFNPFLPKKPVIKPGQSESVSQPSELKKNSNIYLSKFSFSENIIEETQCPAELVKMTEDFVKIFKEKLENKDHKTLTEALIDFMYSEDQYYIIKIKSYRLDYLPSKIIKDPLLFPYLVRKSIADSELVNRIFSGNKKKINMTGLTQANLIQRLNKIESKNKVLKASGLKYIDMEDIKHNRIQSYSNTPSILTVSSPLNRGLNTPAGEVIIKYEDFRNSLSPAVIN